MFKDELGITLKGPESPWSLAHRNRLPECIKQLSASICRRNGTAAPEGEADTNSRLYQLQSQRGDPHEIVLPIPDGGGAGLKREDIDYLVKVLHHDVADLATVDFNQQICVQESCAQLIPEGSDVAKAKALAEAFVKRDQTFYDFTCPLRPAPCGPPRVTTLGQTGLPRDCRACMDSAPALLRPCARAGSGG